MDTLLDLFPNLVHYLELLPVACVAVLSGAAHYFSLADETERKEGKAFFVAKIVFTSAFLALLVYATLSATDLPYLAKVGISAAVGYFGIDKAIELAQKALSLRRSGGEDDATKAERIRKNVDSARKRTRKTDAKE